ncbi:MAG: LAGLIDADG family homing endonuclease [Candidatus Gracilibacteria bacterium]
MEINTFFTEWSPEMAYILGFFAADGSMYVNPRISKYIVFYSTDKEILWKMKSILCVKQKIGILKRDPIKYPNWKLCYRLQIGDKSLFDIFLKLGFTPNKSKSLKYPNVPKKYIKDFIRGYFDGDGFSCFSRYHRKDRNSTGKIISSGFVCGNKDFLLSIKSALEASANICGGTLCSHARAYNLTFSIKNSAKLFNFMYNGVAPRLYLSRKRLEFERNLKKYWS